MRERPAASERRPALTTALTGTELQHWYWLRSELQTLARQLGVSPSGGKALLTARVAAALDGHIEPSPARRRTRRSTGVALSGALTPDTVLPEGQRCSQSLRAFFVDQVGPAFRFDGVMRTWVATSAGRPLAEGVALWRSSRGAPKPDIAPQFEFNRFLREWHAAHPGAGHREALAAWADHRATPADGREPARQGSLRGTSRAT